MLPAAPNQTCPHCRLERPATAEWWPIKKGKVRSDICVPCNRARFKKYEMDRKTQTAARAAVQERVEQLAVPNPKAPVAEVPGAPKLPAVRQKRVTLATALDAAVKYVTDNADAVLARVVAHANDPASPHHEWALRALLDRVAPVRAITAIAERDADVGQDAKPAQPPVTIVIQGTPRITASVAKPPIDAIDTAHEAVPRLDDLL